MNCQFSQSTLTSFNNIIFTHKGSSDSNAAIAREIAVLPKRLHIGIPEPIARSKLKKKLIINVKYPDGNVRQEEHDFNKLKTEIDEALPIKAYRVPC